MQAPLLSASEFDISLLTPAMIEVDQGTSSPRSFFGAWAPYVSNAPQVLFMRVSPQFGESFWKVLARGAASTQGVALPPLGSFSANFLRMRAFCGGVEVAPIHRFIIETPIEGRKPMREGLDVFALTDFGPHCTSVRVDMFSEKSPNKADSRTIDPALFTKIAAASRCLFESYALTLNRMSRSASPGARLPLGPHTISFRVRSAHLSTRSSVWMLNARCEVVCKRRARRLAPPSDPRKNFPRLFPWAALTLQLMVCGRSRGFQRA